MHHHGDSVVGFSSHIHHVYRVVLLLDRLTSRDGSCSCRDYVKWKVKTFYVAKREGWNNRIVGINFTNYNQIREGSALRPARSLWSRL